MPSPSPTPQRRRTALTVAGLLCAVAGMVVTVSYSVTLYRLFCSVTGAGGTTQRATADTAARSARQVTVFFSTNLAPNLPWRFVPVQRAITTHLGEETQVLFEAENLSDHDIVGHATFNVTPDASGVYFKKIQCFCFTEERLAAHQKVRMPVDFFVDPDLARDPQTRALDQITLSYTFFRSLRPAGAADLARLAAPDPVAGARDFAAQCAACHALDSNRVGPALDHVIGRRAGTAPGYRYSPALARSAIVWGPDTLEQWLAGPRTFVPGARMPVAVSDPEIRRDIIAYLARQGAAHDPDQEGAADQRVEAPARTPG
jgi:cytochrome c oxidase assembly protein Cox11